VACLSAPNACSNSGLFPPDEVTPWEKDHWRLDRRRLARATVTPEEIGLCGCWQVIAVRREREELDPDAEGPSDEIGYYATSVAAQEMNEAELLDVIRGHWSAIENGVHHRRDVSFGEDACRVADRTAAHALATLRNLAIGLYEIECSRDRVAANGLKSWCRRMTVAAALKLLRS
jgi:predicted transposase YbfD/YdcC